MAVREVDFDRPHCECFFYGDIQLLGSSIFVKVIVRSSYDENDTAFKYDMDKRTKRSEHDHEDHENDGSRLKAYMYRRAKSKPDEYNMGAEYLEETQNDNSSIFRTFLQERIKNVNQDDEEERKSEMSRNRIGNMFEKQSSADKVPASNLFTSVLAFFKTRRFPKREWHDIAEGEDVKKTQRQRNYTSTFIRETNLSNIDQALSFISAEKCTCATVSKKVSRFESHEKKRQFYFSFRGELKRKYRLRGHFAQDIVSVLDLLDYIIQVLRRHSTFARRSIERGKNEIKPLLDGVSGYMELKTTKNQKRMGSHRTSAIPPAMVSLSSCSLTPYAVVSSEVEEIATSEVKKHVDYIESSSDTEERNIKTKAKISWARMFKFLIVASIVFRTFSNCKNIPQPWAPVKEIRNAAVVAEETRLHLCLLCETATLEQLCAADVFCVREKDRPTPPENAYHEVKDKDSSEVVIAFDDNKLTDSEPFGASGDDVDIHERGMAKVYIPSKYEDIILEYFAQTWKKTELDDCSEAKALEKKDENNFDNDRRGKRTLDLPNEWMARKRQSQPSVSNLAKDTHFMTEIEKKNNGDVDVSVLIPSTPDIPLRCGASLPIDVVPTAFEADAKTVQKKPKLRLQVVPNSPQQNRKQLKIKTHLRKPETKSGMMFHSDETFRNLKYKIKEDKPRQKAPDFTVKESEFDLFALRNVTWLSLNELPVPWIDLTVAFVPQFDPIMVIIDQIANGTPPTPHISMRYELLRFCTLRSYPKDNKPFIIKLAEAGFYYASDGDGVVCYCCGIRRYNWVEEDIPMKIHQRVNPNCKFLKKNEEVNVPVQYYGPYGKSLMAIMDIPEPVEREDRSEDVNNDWAPERVRSPAASQPNRRSESAANSLGINTAIPKHTQYATKTARVGSYSGWPDTASHTPEVLADAGFFYAGFGDCVRCFFCGIGLRHWTKEDDPWVEHARWARNCVFVKQKKGEEFVNLVKMSVQYSQDNETQSNTNAGNQLPAQEVERLLLSDASQSVLEMGYQPRIIKKAIEQILRQNDLKKAVVKVKYQMV